MWAGSVVVNAWIVLWNTCAYHPFAVALISNTRNLDHILVHKVGDTLDEEPTNQRAQSPPPPSPSHKTIHTTDNLQTPPNTHAHTHTEKRQESNPQPPRCKTNVLPTCAYNMDKTRILLLYIVFLIYTAKTAPICFWLMLRSWFINSIYQGSNNNKSLFCDLIYIV